MRNKTRLALWEEHLKDPIQALDNALKCLEHSWSKVLPRDLLWRKRSAMAGVGLLQSLWEKLIRKGIWPYLDPMDSVCLRTASTVRNVPGKYGPPGELFFFLIQKEPAAVPGSETFSPFFNADIRTPSSLLMSSRSARLSHLHLLAEEGKDGEDGGHAAALGTNGKWAAQRVQRGRVQAKPGRKTKVCLPVALEMAMWATIRCTSSGCMGLVAGSLFLKDLELAKVALS